jgi:hypothetical protein
MAALHVDARGIPPGRRRAALTTIKISMRRPKQMAEGPPHPKVSTGFFWSVWKILAEDKATTHKLKQRRYYIPSL